MKLENCEEQFNSPKIVVDINKYERNKKGQEEIKEMDIFRDEIRLIKQEVDDDKNKKEEEKRKGMSGSFLRGTEILQVVPEFLTKEDLELYKDLKKCKAGKITIEKFEEKLENYRRRFANKKNNSDKKNNQSSDTYKVSGINFLAWLKNKAICEIGIRKYAKKNNSLKYQSSN
ncbi:hypothetical protein JW698_02870 [Candidatus Wolfebacteria bacterium]|nr:hypothetical protein [Candidatus Wolfebacteria bacterium]